MCDELDQQAAGHEAELLREALGAIQQMAEKLRRMAGQLERTAKQVSDLNDGQQRLEARLSSLERELGAMDEPLAPPEQLN